MKYTNFLIVLFIFSFLFFSGCSTELDIADAKYEPKIVIDAYIYPNQKVQNILLTKNFPLNSPIDYSKIILTNAKATITDIESGRIFNLIFNPMKFSYEYSGSELMIDYGKSYRLDVSALIDGQQLNASSVTTVPKDGFKITNKNIDSLKYHELNNNGEIKNFFIDFELSKDAQFYALSITALEGNYNTFIWDNAYFKIDSVDLVKNIDNFKFQSTFLLNVKPEALFKSFKIEWLQIWFYGYYRTIVYATDVNFKDFYLTHKRVQEPDGNFHEPKMHIEGDGIGIFGSAIVDTVYFKVYK